MSETNIEMMDNTVPVDTIAAYSINSAATEVIGSLLHYPNTSFTAESVEEFEQLCTDYLQSIEETDQPLTEEEEKEISSWAERTMAIHKDFMNIVKEVSNEG